MRSLAVIDWESAALGDPMADIATTRLDLRWAYGAELAERFTHRYLTMTGRSTATLPVWELVVSLRPAGAVSLWASDMAAHGRPDITADSMRTNSTPTSTAHSNASVPPRSSIRAARQPNTPEPLLPTEHTGRVTATRPRINYSGAAVRSGMVVIFAIARPATTAPNTTRATTTPTRS